MHTHMQLILTSLSFFYETSENDQATSEAINMQPFS